MGVRGGKDGETIPSIEVDVDAGGSEEGEIRVVAIDASGSERMPLI